jgi:hypothetical protein
MEDSLKDINLKNNDLENLEEKKIPNTNIITNIEINQSLSNQINNEDILKNKNSKEINENSDKDNHKSSIDNNDSESLKSLKEDSEIVCPKNSRNNNKRINISLKEESKGTYNKRFTKTNYSYLNRFIDYEKRKESKIFQLQKQKNDKEKKNLKKKPIISRKSVELISRLNLNDNILERMNDEEKKAKDRKEKLIQKINMEREKKKKEIEKPNSYNIKLTKFDNKFDKIYNEMMKKDEKLKSKINAFSDMVKEYEMRECVFQPNFFKYNNKIDDNKRKKRISSSDVTKRLYNDEIKNRRNRINQLNEKYKLTFKPNISNKSVDLAIRKREKMRLSQEKNDEIKNNLDENNIE